MNKQTSKLVTGLSGILMAMNVQAVMLEHEVLATDNLYYTDWGHWFTNATTGDPLDNALTAPGSTSARAVDYNFTTTDFVTISTTGSVIDAGIYSTGPDGCGASDPADCYFGTDGNIYGQTAYSMIGLWSSSATSIDPIYIGDTYTGNASPWDDFFDAVFLVGSSITLEVPEGTDAYLFLAENDGLFYDNSGSYQVTLTTRNAVPEIDAGSAGIALALISALVGLFRERRPGRR
jgi:hypothetical protein